MTPRPNDDPPIACTLGASDFQARVAWIADLNRQSLLSEHREDLRLTLIYRRSARHQVEEMITRERECCAFLKFAVSDIEDGVLLTITAPEAARDAMDAVFAPFQSTPHDQPPVSGCGCCAGASA